MKYLSAVACLMLTMMTLETEIGAIEPAPVPLFEVIDFEGRSVQSDQLPLQGKALLIYVQPHCPPCDALLNRFKKDSGADLSRKMILVVGGTEKEAKALAGRFPDLAQAGWYVDPLKNAYLQLKLQGAPVVLGVHNGVIAWSVDGALSPSKTLHSLFTTWFEK